MSTPTKEETLEALDKSIAHWDRLRSGKRLPDEGIGSEHCELCVVFNKAPGYCEGCPVYEFTKKRYCLNTPYYTAHRLFHVHGPTSLSFLAAAEEEYQFLVNLRKNL